MTTVDRTAPQRSADASGRPSEVGRAITPITFGRSTAGRVKDSLVDAWHTPGVLSGLIGVLLITIGSLTPGYLPDEGPTQQIPGVHLLATAPGSLLGTVALMIGVGLLIDAWLRLRPMVAHTVSYPAVIAIWSLPFLLAPPIFSADAYAYAAEGWLIHNGLNPYEVGVGSLPGAFADQTVLVWRWTPAPYGPLDLVLNHWVVDLFGHHPYWAVVGMRLPVIAAVALMFHLLPKLAARMGADSRLTLWLGLANPLVFLHFIGGAHNDAIMIGLVVLALWLGMQGRLGWGVLAVAAAAAIKVPAILAVLAVAVLADPVLSRSHPLALPAHQRAERWNDPAARIWRTVRRGVVASVLVIAMFLAINLATGLGFGWIPGMNVPGMVQTMSPSTMIGEAFSQLFYSLGMYDMSWAAVRLVRTTFMVACVVLVGWMALRLAHRRPVTSLAWSLAAVAFCGPVLHGWYLSWVGSLLGLTRPTRRVLRAGIWLSVGLVGYIAVNLAWKNDATIIGAVGLGLLVWRLADFDRAHLRPACSQPLLTDPVPSAPLGSDAATTVRPAAAPLG